jgi:hypothetical protein
MEAKSIKELEELLEGIKEGFMLGKAIRDIVADGVDVSDIPAAFELVKKQADKFSIYEAAVKDVDMVKEEIKDLSKEEIMKLLLVIIDGISAVEKA